ncbi:iron ABC transporter permease [Gleimia hominis]|uniref:Iron ABC transporter permease n=1 Tax=Gleimia hominis TaxID=595468 RepID=A0ABU3ICP0_9ACTO|nr:iron ABC transporter permease [Gleimia hominis]MDT3768145.1 iron ABC transporter permease [Gleimia hominis]
MSRARTALVWVSPVIVFMLALSVGRYPVSLGSLYDATSAYLTGAPMDAGQLALIRVRLPRVLVAMIVGAALSSAGAAFQGLFRNPVVSPDLLGASSGASFGAALAIFVGISSLGIQVVAFTFGLLAVIIVATLNGLLVRRANTIITLILCGMLIGSLFNAFVSLLKFVADTETKLPAITFWLMGSLAGTQLSDLKILWLFVPVMLVLQLVRWKINLLSLGDEEAKMLGVNVAVYRWLIIGCATLLTSLSVAVSGNIGWIGLVVPHLARMLVGSNYGRLMPATILLGSSFLLLVDTVARLLFTVEVPLGILTAIVGAPFFCVLLFRAQKGFV